MSTQARSQYRFALEPVPGYLCCFSRSFPECFQSAVQAACSCSWLQAVAHLMLQGLQGVSCSESNIRPCAEVRRLQGSRFLGAWVATHNIVSCGMFQRLQRRSGPRLPSCWEAVLLDWLEETASPSCSGGDSIFFSQQRRQHLLLAAPCSMFLLSK